MVRIISAETPSLLTYKSKQNVPKLLINKIPNLRVTDINTFETFNVNLYKMLDLKSGHIVGSMYARPIKNMKCDEIYPEHKTCNAFKIELLRIKEKRKGYGGNFIKFAQAESKKEGCNGRVFLNANIMYDPQNPCHIFYRKKGFTTTDKRFNTKLDKCIKTNKKPTSQFFRDILMYLPDIIEQPQQQVSRLSKMLKNLTKYII